MTHVFPERKRLQSIDVLRGIALLGIFLINIVGMGLPDPAYFDPSLSGGHHSWNLKVFIINSLFFEGTMRGLFSLLFGAGILLFFMNKKDDHSQEAIIVWFRRLLWLIPIGMVHAYILLWPGDILFAYGLIGLMLFPFKDLKPITLLIISLLIITVGIFLNIQDAKTAKQEQQEYFKAVSMLRKGQQLPYDTMISYYNWIERYAIMKPTKEILSSRIENYHQGYRKAFKENKPYAKFFESEYHYRHNYIDILSMMLLGMALLKWRILQAEKSALFYAVIMTIGYIIGIAINQLEVRSYIESEYNLIHYYELLRTYDLGRIATMFGHIGLVMLFCKVKWGHFIKSALASVGKMALTNYIMHSIIALVIFVGFRQYGTWERYELYYIVFATWMLQLIISPLWLKYFNYGPLEWLWRNLSYMKYHKLIKER